MSRPALTDAHWAVIEPLLPAQKLGPGRRRADNRRPLNGLLHVLKTGCAWEERPREDGAPTTCWRRLHAWAQDGTWERVWRARLSQLDAQGKMAWAQAFLDGRLVPAKQGGPASARPKAARARR